MDKQSPVKYPIVKYDEDKKEATITDVFITESGEEIQFKDMDDDNVVRCLHVATLAGIELERKGYKVHY